MPRYFLLEGQQKEDYLDNKKKQSDEKRNAEEDRMNRKLDNKLRNRNNGDNKKIMQKSKKILNKEFDRRGKDVDWDPYSDSNLENINSIERHIRRHPKYYNQSK